MINSVFITEKGFYSPRWHQAFPNANLVEASDQAALSVPAGLIWILTGVAGWEAQIRHQTAQGNTVIAITRNPQINELRQALTAGARGYLEALSSQQILTQAAQTVCAGGMWLPAELVTHMIGLLSPMLENTGSAAGDTESLLSKLTTRERQVAAEVIKGSSNKRIAITLNITERTVKAHLSSVFEKLGARDRMHLVLLAREQGLC